MKKHIAYIISAAAILFSAVSCDKLPENGKLDGMWQIMSINYAHDSEYDSLVDIKSQKVYLSFQLKLAQIRTGTFSNEVQTDVILSRFKYKGSSLSLYNFYRKGFAEDQLLTDSATTSLRCFGIDGISADFHIDKLNGSEMQLSSDYARIICHKF